MTKNIVPGVAGPHAGEDLAHSTQVLLHLTFFDRFAFFCKLACSHAMCKILEKRDGIVDVQEVGFEADAGTVLLQLGPVGTV